MSDENETETPKPQAPAQCWDPIKFTKATPAEITPTVVDCKTCPVFLLCESSTGGSGYTCQECGATGVWIDEDNEDEVIVVDCGKHKFLTNEDRGKLPKCALCSGQLMKFEYREHPPKNHMLFTIHAKIPWEKRQTQMTEHLDYWQKYYTEEEAREKREREQAAAKKSK